MRRKLLTITSIVMLLVLSFALVACNTTSLASITKIKSFDKIEKIVIAENNRVVDGVHVSVRSVKTFDEEKDILAIYNILNRADYRKAVENNDDVPKYSIRIYVKGETGYIEYNWDRSFVAKDGYEGKLKAGYFSMDKANEALAEIKEIFYRD